jgi:hypothetical protein
VKLLGLSSGSVFEDARTSLSKLADLIDHLERSANWVSDIDREWWPFLFLRPARNRRLSTARAALLATLYGVFVGMVANLGVLSAGERMNHVYTLPVVLTIVFFALYRLTFAAAWNRRAERIKGCRRANSLVPQGDVHRS